MKCDIRRLTGADSEEYAERYWELMGQLTNVDCVSSEMKLGYFSMSMDMGFWIFGAFETGHLVGITSMHFLRHMKGSEARIEDVVVDAEYRRRGICRSLIMQAESMIPVFSERFAPWRIYKITLAANPNAEEVYKKLGFKAHEREYRKDVVVWAA